MGRSIPIEEKDPREKSQESLLLSVGLSELERPISAEGFFGQLSTGLIRRRTEKVSQSPFEYLKRTYDRILGKSRDAQRRQAIRLDLGVPVIARSGPSEVVGPVWAAPISQPRYGARKGQLEIIRLHEKWKACF
jgi:hypothetical protein